MPVKPRMKQKKEELAAHITSPATLQNDIKTAAGLAMRDLLARGLRMEENHLAKLKLSVSSDGRLYVFFETKASEGPQFSAGRQAVSAFRAGTDTPNFVTICFELVDKNSRPALKEAFRFGWDIMDVDNIQGRIGKFKKANGLSGAEREIFFSRNPAKVEEMLKVYKNLTGEQFEKLDPMTLDTSATFPHGTYQMFAAVPKM